MLNKDELDPKNLDEKLQGDEEEKKAKKDEDDIEETAASDTIKTQSLNAAVNDIMKTASKEQKEKIYASVQNLMKMKKEDVDVSHIDYEEDLNTLVSEEATLSDSFRDKASVIFESALKSKVATETIRLEESYETQLVEKVEAIKEDLVDKVDSYLNYVVENWMSENEVAITTGLKSEIAEDFMKGLHSVFVENYIDVPESKVDVVEELAETVTELEEKLNTSTTENIELYEQNIAYAKENIIRENSEGLASTEVEKLKALVEDIDYKDEDSFKLKITSLKESFFKGKGGDSLNEEVNNLIGQEVNDEDQNSAMSQYVNALK